MKLHLLCGAALLLSTSVIAEKHVPAVDQKVSSNLPHNASSCSECHNSPAPGGSSRIVVLHAGHLENGAFVPVPGGVLHSFSSSMERHYLSMDLVRGDRVTMGFLGDGLVEAVSDADLVAIARRQVEMTDGRIHGQTSVAPLMQIYASRNFSQRRTGRFGWKAQHATVFSASADALRNELGIPNPLYSDDGEQDTSKAAVKLQALADYVRKTKPIARDQNLAATPSAETGSQLFDQIGCAICHVRVMHTMPRGTKISSTYAVPVELGDKTFYPFSDYLLHDVGTGDGIVQSATPEYADQTTANKFRTAPLWGLRYRTWLMHDGKSVTYHQAIMRHKGEASEVVRRYERLTPIERHQLREFLDSL